MCDKHSSCKQLVWSQRLALVRHNLHISHYTHDFTFFRTLQLQTLLNNTDHASNLANALDSSVDSHRLVQSQTTGIRRSSDALDADVVIASLDSVAAVIANVYEDAVRSLCKAVRSAAVTRDAQKEVSTDNETADVARMDACRIAARQRTQAEASIDKMLDNAVVLIAKLPPTAQDEAAAIFIQSIAFVADAISVCLVQMERIECAHNDASQLDTAIDTAASVVAQAVSAMKGVFRLMDGSGDCNQQPAIQRQLEGVAIGRDEKRSSMTFSDPGSLARGWARRLSAALTQSSSPAGSTAGSRKSSLTPSGLGLQLLQDQHLRQQASGRPNTPSHERAALPDHATSERTRNVRLSSGLAHKLSPMPSTPSHFLDPLLNANHLDRAGLAPEHVPATQPNDHAFKSNALPSTVTPDEAIAARNPPITPLSKAAFEDEADPLDMSRMPKDGLPARRRSRNVVLETGVPYVLPERPLPPPAVMQWLADSNNLTEPAMDTRSF